MNSTSSIPASQKHYRAGALGALIDEYERAAAELIALIHSITDAEYEVVVDAETSDDDCHSIQTMMAHIVGSAHGYAGHIRTQFGLESKMLGKPLFPRAEFASRLQTALAETAAIFEGKWEMTKAEADALVPIKTRYGGTYDLEQMLEHTIVHILRHRRQSERFLQKLRASVTGQIMCRKETAYPMKPDET